LRDVEADIATRSETDPSVPPNDEERRRREVAAETAAGVFDDGEDLVLVIGWDGRLLHASSAWTRWVGERAVVGIGRALPDAIRVGSLASADWPPFERALSATILDGSQEPIALDCVHPEYGPRRLECDLHRPSDRTGNVVLVFRDATTRWSALKELVESDRRFRTIAEASQDMVTETDSEGRFAYVSPACTQVLGYSADELLSRSPLKIHHEEDRESFRQEVLASQEEGKPFSVRPHRLRRKDGTWIWVEATGVRYRRPDGEMRLVGVARDITSRLQDEEIRQQLEEQLRSAQKLESLGILAGGIAHDFNNFLTPIVGTAALMSADLPEGSSLKRHVELIRKAARRATDLTAQMLAIAGGTEPQFVSLDLSQAIRGMQLILDSTAAHRAKLTYDLDPDLPPIRADDGQMGQIVMNLVANSAEAIGDAGGRIEVRTGLMEADRDSLREFHFGEQREPGTYVFIEVRDDGAGIDDETREQIFDPFFSTKFTGRGLGLAVVLGIVKSHRGALRIESESGAGTRFRILLPIAAETQGGSTQPGDEVGRAETAWAQRGAVLVVDDDEGAREITSILLERAGFDVLSEGDGARAIEEFRRNAEEIAAVVLDNTMPGLSGTQVFDAIREIAPNVPVVLASGYSRERVSDTLLASGKTRFLHKPFDTAQLLDALRQLLEAP